MPIQRVRIAGLTAVGFQTITCANSTAVGLNSTMQAAHVLELSVETNSARFRADGSDPTRNTGVLLAAGVHTLSGYPAAALKFQRSTGTSKISIMGFKYPADSR